VDTIYKILTSTNVNYGSCNAEKQGRPRAPDAAEALSRRRAVVHVIGHKLQHNSVKRA